MFKEEFNKLQLLLAVLCMHDKKKFSFFSLLWSKLQIRYAERKRKFSFLLRARYSEDDRCDFYMLNKVYVKILERSSFIPIADDQD